MPNALIRLGDAVLAWANSVHLADAALGAVVGAVFAAVLAGVKRLWDLLPLRRFLGDLADNSLVLGVFVRDMRSIDNKYISTFPDFNPPYTSNRFQAWQNIPHVVGRADVEAAADMLNLLGRAGRSKNIVWRSVERDFDLWTDPILCTGGSPKADKVLDLCEPRVIRLEEGSRFVTIPDGRVFELKGDGYDYGLIYKGRHPQTRRTCLVLLGIGVTATYAAGRFLRSNARLFRRLYGGKPFAAIVRARSDFGRDSAELVCLASAPNGLAKVFHLPTWLRYRSLAPARRQSGHLMP